MKISRKMKIAIAGALVTLSLCGCTEAREFRRTFQRKRTTSMYVVEDLSGAEVDKYTYEISFLPETFQTFSITSND